MSQCRNAGDLALPFIRDIYRGVAALRPVYIRVGTVLEKA